MIVRIIAPLVLLAACATQPDKAPLPADLAPVEIEAVQRSLIAANPGADAFSALSPTGRGVIFALDGTATYIDPSINQVVETTVSGFTDNTMCVAEAGLWSGLCIDLYQKSDGSYFCEGTFGDGAAFNYPCALVPVTRPT